MRFFERHELIHNCPDLNSGELFILLRINEYLGANDCCWPSHAVIAKDTRLSVRTVIRHLNRLEAKGILIVNHRFDGERQTSNSYAINWQALKAKGSETASHRADQLTEQHCDAAHCHQNKPPDPVKRSDQQPEVLDPDLPANRTIGIPPSKPLNPTVEAPPPKRPLNPVDPKSSGSKPEPKQSKQKQPGSDFWAKVTEVYNAHKPDLWAALDKPLNPRRGAALVQLWREEGESEVLRQVSAALSFAQRDPFWGTKPLTIDNLLRQGRVTELSERWQALSRNEPILRAISNPADARARQRQQELVAKLQSHYGREGLSPP